MNSPPKYFAIFLAFARNSLVRDMTFRTNFLVDCVTSITWTAMNLGFYLLVFNYTKSIGAGTGWGVFEFLVFLGTTMIVNSLVQAFFMPNCEELSELIRTGGLDFALLKPIDTQFLISLRKIEWSGLANFFAGGGLVAFGLFRLMTRPENPISIGPLTLGLYLLYLACGVAILYSIMISLASTSIWLGQNRSLYDFWFYITNFSRYPMEIYQGAWGDSLRLTFTYALPVLLVVNVPARVLAQPLHPESSLSLMLAVHTLVGAGLFLAISRWLFSAALRGYRSASS